MKFVSLQIETLLSQIESGAPGRNVDELPSLLGRQMPDELAQPRVDVTPTRSTIIRLVSVDINNLCPKAFEVQLDCRPDLP